MKIKKIIIFILAMLVIFSVPTSYAKDAVPAANSSSSKIEQYVKNNEISSVSIDKLVAWYNKVENSNNVKSKIVNALKSKNVKDINSYISDKSKAKLKKVPSEVRSAWSTKCNEGNRQKLNSVSDKKDTLQELPSSSEVSDPTINPDIYQPGTASSTKVQGKVGPILGIIRNVGIVLSVIFLMIIGVQAMLGSAEERADYKKRLPKYLIGVVVLLAGSVIPQLIYNVMK